MKGERIPWEKESKIPARNVPGDIEESIVNGIAFDVRKLIHATEGHPVVKKPFHELLAKLDTPCWVDKNEQPLRPQTLIDLIVAQGYDGARKLHPEYAKHISKIEHANYSFPIHLYTNAVINGMHRISKLAIERALGNTDQDFLTVKELRTIPEVALTTRGLLRKPKNSNENHTMSSPEEQSQPQAEKIEPRTPQKEEVFAAVVKTGLDNPETRALVEAWMKAQEAAMLHQGTLEKIQAHINIAEYYGVTGDLQGAHETLEEAHGEAKLAEERGQGDPELIKSILNVIEEKLKEYAPESE